MLALVLQEAAAKEKEAAAKEQEAAAKERRVEIQAARAARAAQEQRDAQATEVAAQVAEIYAAAKGKTLPFETMQEEPNDNTPAQPEVDKENALPRKAAVVTLAYDTLEYRKAAAVAAHIRNMRGGKMTKK